MPAAGDEGQFLFPMPGLDFSFSSKCVGPTSARFQVLQRGSAPAPHVCRSLAPIMLPHPLMRIGRNPRIQRPVRAFSNIDVPGHSFKERDGRFRHQLRLPSRKGENREPLATLSRRPIGGGNHVSPSYNVRPRLRLANVGPPGTRTQHPQLKHMC